MVLITGNAENELFICPADAVIGDAVYISASKTVAYADSSDIVKHAQGIIWLKVSGTTCKIRFEGGIIHTTGLTAGSNYYLTSTATTTNTLSTTVSIFLVGIALSTTELYLILNINNNVATEVQSETGLTSTGNGSSNQTIGRTQTQFGLSLTGVDNAGTFNSARVTLQASRDDSTWTNILTIEVTSTTEYSDFIWFPGNFSDFTLANGQLTDTTYVRRVIDTIDLTGNATLSIKILQIG